MIQGLIIGNAWGWQGLVYVAQSVQREPLDQTDLKDGVDAT